MKFSGCSLPMIYFSSSRINILWAEFRTDYHELEIGCESSMPPWLFFLGGGEDFKILQLFQGSLKAFFVLLKRYSKILE